MEFRYAIPETDERSDLDCLFDPATHISTSEIYADILARYEVRRAAAEAKLRARPKPRPILPDPIERMFDEAVMRFRDMSIDPRMRTDTQQAETDATEIAAPRTDEGTRPRKTASAALSDLPLEILFEIGRMSMNPAFYLVCQKTAYVLDLERDEVKHMATMFALNPATFCDGCSGDYADWLLDQPWASRQQIVDAYCWWLQNTVAAETRKYVHESRGYAADYRATVPTKARRVFPQLHAMTTEPSEFSARYNFSMSKWSHTQGRGRYVDFFRVMINWGYRCGLRLPVVSIDRIQFSCAQHQYNYPRLLKTVENFTNSRRQWEPSERRRIISLPVIPDRFARADASDLTSTMQFGSCSRDETRNFLAASTWITSTISSDQFDCVPQHLDRMFSCVFHPKSEPALEVDQLHHEHVPEDRGGVRSIDRSIAAVLFSS